jgi:hypothetical protein
MATVGFFPNRRLRGKKDFCLNYCLANWKKGEWGGGGKLVLVFMPFQE